MSLPFPNASYRLFTGRICQIIPADLGNILCGASHYSISYTRPQLLPHHWIWWFTVKSYSKINLVKKKSRCQFAEVSFQSAVGHNWQPQIGNVPVKRMISPRCPPQASGGSSQIKPDHSRARLKTVLPPPSLFISVACGNNKVVLSHVGNWLASVWNMSWLCFKSC